MAVSMVLLCVYVIAALISAAIWYLILYKVLKWLKTKLNGGPGPRRRNPY